MHCLLPIPVDLIFLSPLHQLDLTIYSISLADNLIPPLMAMESPKIPSNSSHKLPLRPLEQHNDPVTEQLNTGTSSEHQTSKTIEMTQPRSEVNGSQREPESIPVDMVESKKKKKKTSRSKIKRGKVGPLPMTGITLRAKLTRALCRTSRQGLKSTAWTPL